MRTKERIDGKDSKGDVGVGVCSLRDEEKEWCEEWMDTLVVVVVVIAGEGEG